MQNRVAAADRGRAARRKAGEGERRKGEVWAVSRVDRRDDKQRGRVEKNKTQRGTIHATSSREMEMGRVDRKKNESKGERKTNGRIRCERRNETGRERARERERKEADG